MIPFHPTVVRGFSKYVRMTISKSSPNFSRWVFSHLAYSIAAFGSCIEHGPITTINFLDFWLMISTIFSRASKTVRLEFSDCGISATTSLGLLMDITSKTRVLINLFCDIDILLASKFSLIVLQISISSFWLVSVFISFSLVIKNKKPLCLLTSGGASSLEVFC